MKNVRDLLHISGRNKDRELGDEGGGGNTRWKKALAWTAAVLALLIVLAAVAPLLIDLNRYKGAILSRIRPAVNRNVDFQSVKLTILTGFGAQLVGLRVPENPAFAAGDFVSVEGVQVRLKILPLLKGEVRIARLLFDSPEVHVRRNAAGVFNFADMVKPKKDKEEKSKLPAILASLGISDLTVRDGAFTFEDRKIPAGTRAAAAPAKGRSFTLADLDASLENISLTGPVDIDVRGGMFGAPRQNFSVKGTMGPVGLSAGDSPIPLDLAIGVNGLSLKALTEGLGLSSRAASGLMTGEIQAKGSVRQKIDAAVKLAVDNLVMQRKPGAPAPAKAVQPARLDLNGRVAYESEAKDVTLQNVRLGIGASAFTLTGTVKHVTDAPAWDMTVHAPALDTGSLQASAPALGLSLPADLRLAGPGSFQLSATGTSRDMALKADLALTKAEIVKGKSFRKAPGIVCTLAANGGMKQGVLNFRALTIALHNLVLMGTGRVDTKARPPEMNIQLASRPASLQGWDALVPAMNAFGLGGDMTLKAGVTGTTKSPRFSLQASSAKLGLTLPPSKTKKGARPTPVALQGLTLDVRGGTAEKKLSADGAFGFAGGTYGQVALSRASGTFNFTGGKFDVPAIQMGVFGGLVNARATYATATKDWTFSPTMKGINAGQALNTLTSFKDIFTGTLSGRMQIRGRPGAQSGESLLTQGTLAIDKGTMNNMDLMQSVVDGLTGVPGLSGMAAGQGVVQRNKVTQFDSLATDIGFARKLLTVNSLKLSNIRTGKETNSLATLQGTVDMATRKVGLKGGVLFSPEYSARLARVTPALNALQNDQRRIELPIQITGAVNRPVLFLNTREIARQVADFYTKKGVEKGLESIRKRLNIPGGPGSSPGKDGTSGSQGGKRPGSAVDDFLRGVLPK